MTYIRLHILFFGLLTSSFAGFGQVSQLITGDFSGLKFGQFVQQIERATPCHFYYDPLMLDTFPVNIRVNEMLLSDLLKQIFKNSIFHFLVDSLNRVLIINKRFSVEPALAEDFFNRKKNRPDESGISVHDRPPESSEKQKLQTGIENKLFEIGTKPGSPGQGNVTLAGYVREAKNGEALVSANLYLDGTTNGVTTDKFGYYSLTLPKGRHALQISSMGMKATKREIMVFGVGILNIEMQDDIPTLKTVLVVAEKNSNVMRMQMGVEQLNIKVIKKVPVLLGEPDILRVVLTLPGVTSVGEGSTGFNVRGGSADQNLVLLNNATIYNPSHLFGFFSAFNPDVVKNVELYKSSIPEKYGGRLSSVLEVGTRDGNSKKWTGSGGIGLLTSKLTIEGPLKKDKTSVILGGRTSYSNWLLTRVPDSDYKNSRASFYDIDLHLSHTLNAKNILFLSAYVSNDKFRLSNDTLYTYGNRNIIARWKHIFSNKLNATAAAGLDYYHYAVSGDVKTVNGYELKFKISQTHFRTDFSYSPSNNHNISFGINSILYNLQPGSFQPMGSQSLVVPEVIPSERALESAVYIGDKFDINSKFSISGGLRYSVYNYLGPHDVYSYIEGLPRDVSTVKDTSVYGKGKIINTYHGPEIRLSLRYILSDHASIKASYNTLRQYIHLLSNTSAISPTDIWKLSDPNIKPQQGEQVSVGFYNNFKSNAIDASVEFYYRRIRNYLDYKSGATLVLNPHIETDVINTTGHAYGAEISLKKLTGKLNGWLSYTYSRTELKMDDSTAGQLINNGKYYPANFDKPHNVNFIANYRFTHRYSISLNTVYTTGRPITLPIAIFNLAGSQRLFYSERNQYRVPDYFRIDFSVNIESNHKVKQRIHNSWSIGVYNLTGRKNPYSIYFVAENGVIKGYKLSIIGTAVPYITFNFRF